MATSFHTVRLKVASIFAIIFAMYHFYTGYFGVPGLWVHRGIHMCGILIYVFLKTGWLEKEKGFVKIYTPFCNVIALPSLIFCAAYIVSSPTEIQLRQGSPTVVDTVACILLIVLIIEAARRLLGQILAVIGIVMMSYILFGQYIPGPLQHPGFSQRVVVSFMFNTFKGLFGTPVGVASTYIIMFVIFGAFLNTSGGGDFFSDLAGALSRGKIGGPAKTAVLASAFMGMISGSPVANVAGTGVFTIPLMKKNGYSPEFAGGVEAAASVGGCILPPIMGSAVFLMAEITATPYLEICIRAAYVALLYFAIVYLSVHIEAIRRGLKPLETDDKRSIREIASRGLHYMISLAILVGALIMGFSPTRCALYATISLVVVSWFKESTRMGPRKILECFRDSTNSCMVVSVACCVAGIVVATVSITGLGIKLASFVTAAAGNSLFIALLMTAASSMLLGMGVNAVASYIVIAVLLAPILNKIGIELFVAHFFCYFFSMTAGLTPPVATVSFTAAGIADANQTKTALNGLMLGITGFIIPFGFAYNPGILLYGSPLNIILALSTVTMGVVMLTLGFRNWMFDHLRLWERITALIAGVLLILPELSVNVVGAVIAVLILGYKYSSVKRQAATM